MTFKQQYFNFGLLFLSTIFISLSTASFCSNLTSTDDKDTPCFLEPSTYNPARLRSASSNLVLPCHVARSKRSTIEWWYQDFQKLVNIKIYPVFPAVRPTVLRFITSNPLNSKHLNETDITDVSALLRQVNVDDSGIYRCVIRPWTPTPKNYAGDDLLEDGSKLSALEYHVELTGPRLCQTSLGALPCFSNMRTSSPTVIDAYQTAFLQCVVQNHNRPVTVFWVVGNVSTSSVLITDYLTSNQHNGDRLRRIFPLSAFDYSIELTINRDTRERAYSCVIDGATDGETTLFTYIVRSINPGNVADKTTKKNHATEITTTTTTTNKPEVEQTTSTLDIIVAHDALTPQEIDELHHKDSHHHGKTKDQKLSDSEDDIDGLLELSERAETSTTI